MHDGWRSEGMGGVGAKDIMDSFRVGGVVDIGLLSLLYMIRMATMHS